MSYGPLIVQEIRKALERRGYQVTPENVDIVAREVQRNVQKFMRGGKPESEPFDPKQAQVAEDD